MARLARVVPLLYELTLTVHGLRTATPPCTVVGAARVHVRHSGPAGALPVRTLRLDAASALRRLTVGAPHTLKQRTADAVIVALQPPLQPGGVATVALAWESQVGATQSLVRLTHPAGAHAGAVLVTDAEPDGAHSIFPCVDAPGAKAAFLLTLHVALSIADEGAAPLVAASAGALHAETHTAERSTWTFARSPPLPPYAFAFTVGTWAVAAPVHHSHGVIPRVLYAPWQRAVPPNHARTAAAHAAALVAATTAAALNTFGPNEFLRANPSPAHIAVPLSASFAGAAMENVGAVTYDEDVLLVDEVRSGASASAPVDADAAALLDRSLTVAHETTHMWFGNAATPADWTNLWVSEALATWAEAQLARTPAGVPLFGSNAAKAAYRVATEQLSALLTAALPSAQAVVNPRVSGDGRRVHARFDDTSYAMGASLLAWVEAADPAAFIAALKRYAAARAGAVGVRDGVLQAALAGVSPVASAQLAHAHATSAPLVRAGDATIVINTLCAPASRWRGPPLPWTVGWWVPSEQEGVEGVVAEAKAEAEAEALSASFAAVAWSTLPDVTKSAQLPPRPAQSAVLLHNVGHAAPAVTVYERGLLPRLVLSATTAIAAPSAPPWLSAWLAGLLVDGHVGALVGVVDPHELLAAVSTVALALSLAPHDTESGSASSACTGAVVTAACDALGTLLDAAELAENAAVRSSVLRALQSIAASARSDSHVLHTTAAQHAALLCARRGVPTAVTTEQSRAALNAAHSVTARVSAARALLLGPPPSSPPSDAARLGTVQGAVVSVPQAQRVELLEALVTTGRAPTDIETAFAAAAGSGSAKARAAVWTVATRHEAALSDGALEDALTAGAAAGGSYAAAVHAWRRRMAHAFNGAVEAVSVMQAHAADRGTAVARLAMALKRPAACHSPGPGVHSCTRKRKHTQQHTRRHTVRM